MRRRAAKVDRNQAEIVAALRGIGVSVQPLHAVGGGVPDLLCGQRGVNVLIEVKDGAKPPSKRTLTGEQIDWRDAWRGQWATVKDVNEALALFGVGRTLQEEP
jgi:hypothetical protein